MIDRIPASYIAFLATRATVYPFALDVLGPRQVFHQFRLFFFVFPSVCVFVSPPFYSHPCAKNGPLYACAKSDRESPACKSCRRMGLHRLEILRRSLEVLRRVLRPAPILEALAGLVTPIDVLIASD